MESARHGLVSSDSDGEEDWHVLSCQASVETNATSVYSFSKTATAQISTRKIKRMEILRSLNFPYLEAFRIVEPRKHMHD